MVLPIMSFIYSPVILKSGCSLQYDNLLCQHTPTQFDLSLQSSQQGLLFLMCFQPHMFNKSIYFPLFITLGFIYSPAFCSVLEVGYNTYIYDLCHAPANHDPCWGSYNRQGFHHDASACVVYPSFVCDVGPCTVSFKLRQRQSCNHFYLFVLIVITVTTLRTLYSGPTFFGIHPTHRCVFTNGPNTISKTFRTFLQPFISNPKYTLKYIYFYQSRETTPGSEYSSTFSSAVLHA